jgi:hypothetical protein
VPTDGGAYQCVSSRISTITLSSPDESKPDRIETRDSVLAGLGEANEQHEATVHLLEQELRKDALAKGAGAAMASSVSSAYRTR